MSNITIVGDGAWGKSLGFVFAKAGHDISVWSRSKPNLPEHTDAYVLAIPAQAMRSVLSQINISGVMISTAKGFEQSSGLAMADIIKTVSPNSEIYALSGPSFAADVIAGKPTAVALAGPTLEKSTQWANTLSIATFRIYPTDDVKGAEIGGAMKNVLAIACGISDGQGLGESARASLVTRGFAELSRYGRKLGAKPETLMGLSCFGDLQLTCASSKSRNFAYGLAIGKGATPAEAMAQSRGVVEGAFTAAIAARLAREHGVEMPIVEAVAAVIDGRSNPGDEITKLLSRPIKPESL